MCMKQILLVILSITFIGYSFAQSDRYIDRIFPEISVDQNVTYGVNATVLFVLRDSQAIPQPLRMDVYTPNGDVEALRPLVLVFHSGNFLPYPQNGSVSGTMRDSSVVDICRKLASMGYVAASVDYRLGWDPTNPSKDIRVFTLINAAYRGIQDARTCIRFFKRDVAENGNTWKVDTSRITLFGLGTGGYIAANCGALDRYIKIPTASDGKFLIDPGTGTPLPMVLEGVNGNIYGTSVGIVPPPLAPLLRLPPGDTLCYPNHVGYSSDFQLGVNLGGAIADTAWIDPNQVAVISVHNPQDRFAPYKEGLVLVPVTPPLEVVKVQGSYLIQLVNSALGNNKYESVSKNFNDPISLTTRLNNDGLDGLFPIITQNPFDSSPWDYWDPATNLNHANGIRTNPDMTAEKGQRYIDSILAFFAPRACVALNLNCNLSRFISNTKNFKNEDVGLRIVPVPANDRVTISVAPNLTINHAVVYDANGKVVYQINGNNANAVNVNRGNLENGFYYTTLQLSNGRKVGAKIIFN